VDRTKETGQSAVKRRLVAVVGVAVKLAILAAVVFLIWYWGVIPSVFVFFRGIPSP
jgi:hypothetical protein